MFVRLCLVACLVAPVLAPAADPPVLSPADLDRLAADALKDVHNRGADLYNAADAAGALRLYEGALRSVAPFLVSRPKVQKLVGDGLAAAEKLDGAKLKAFRLHELIEAVRAELKPSVAAPAELAKLVRVTGRVTLDGAPLASAAVTLVSLDAAVIRSAKFKTGADGGLDGPDPLPPGHYAVVIDDAVPLRLPPRYGSSAATDLIVRLRAAPTQAVAVKLKSR